MDFSDPPRVRPQENLLPMINVVFLLLIFFLISARMTPPEPFDIIPPASVAEAEARGDFTLFLAADARIGFRDTVGQAALSALAAALSDHCATVECTTAPPRLTLRADAALPAARLAQVLPQLAGLGFAQIELVTRPGPAP